jgi:hypothetical protein
MTFKQLSEFKKKRVREILDEKGILGQPPYYAFIRKIQSKHIKTNEDLQKAVEKYKNQGLNEEAIWKLAFLFRPELRSK